MTRTRMLKSLVQARGRAAARAQWLRAFCPTGPGGGVDPTCSPGGAGGGAAGRAGKQIAEIRELAGKVKFDLESRTVDVDRDDHDGIEAEMTPAERREMAAYIKSERESWADGHDFDPLDADIDIDMEDIASDADYGEEDIRASVASAVVGHPELEAIVEEWDAGRKYGTDAIDDLVDRVLAEGVSDDIRAELEEYAAMAVVEIDTAYLNARSEAESQAEEEYRRERENDFDEDAVKAEYLESFYDDNESRFSGVPEEDDVWQKDADESSVYRFTTESGRSFNISAYAASVAGIPAESIQFADEDGDFGMTGKGDAFEVFSKVVPAITAYIDHTDPEVVTFSALGRSRQRLYDRLTKTVLSVDESRFSVMRDAGNTRHYIVGKNSARGDIEEALAGATKAAVPGKWREVKPEIDPDWWTPGAWEDGDEGDGEKGFCPTGPGGGIDNSCSSRGGSTAPGSPARRTYEEVQEYAKSKEARDSRNGTPDEYLEKLAAFQGFDVLPTKTSPAKLDEMIAAGEVRELHRGVRYEEHATQFMEGAYFGGVGVFGGGTYFAENPNTAANFAVRTTRDGEAHGAIFRAGLHNSAKVGEHEALLKEMESDGRAAVAAAEDMAARHAARSLYSDVGRYATARGYDAIQVRGGDDTIKGEDYYVVLNRGKVIVDGVKK